MLRQLHGNEFSLPLSCSSSLNMGFSYRATQGKQHQCLNLQQKLHLFALRNQKKRSLWATVWVKIQRRGLPFLFEPPCKPWAPHMEDRPKPTYRTELYLNHCPYLEVTPNCHTQNKNKHRLWEINCDLNLSITVR